MGSDYIDSKIVTPMESFRRFAEFIAMHETVGMLVLSYINTFLTKILEGKIFSIIFWHKENWICLDKYCAYFYIEILISYY